MAQILNEHYDDLNVWWNDDCRKIVLEKVSNTIWNRNHEISVNIWWKNKMNEIKKKVEGKTSVK